jgi:hypothetical protein
VFGKLALTRVELTAVTFSLMEPSVIVAAAQGSPMQKFDPLSVRLCGAPFVA